MQKILLFIAFFTFSVPIFSQGFDWQWSARLPFETPRLYYGGNFQYGLSTVYGEISFLEDKIQCQNFQNGNGNLLSFGLNAEYWEERNRFAYRATLQFDVNQFVSKSKDFVPIDSTIIAEYETALTQNFQKINVGIGGKYRIANTHFNIGADLFFSFLINNSFTVTEEILGPPEVPPFSTNPPSYKRDVLDGKINSLNKVQIIPTVSIGYDLQLGLGTYIEPNISLQIPLFSVFSGATVTNSLVSFGLKIHRKI
jgi:hypothetical protein